MTLAGVETDIYSGRTTDDRPGLQGAIARIEEGEADTLIVTKLDRLARSMRDFCDLIERATKNRWNIVVVDMNLDLSTPHGGFVAHVLMAMAQFERELTGLRTSEGMAALAAQGFHMGRQCKVPPEVIARIRTLHAGSMGLRAIARQLNADHVPTVEGGRWGHAQVARLIRRTG